MCAFVCAWVASSEGGGSLVLAIDWLLKVVMSKEGLWRHSADREEEEDDDEGVIPWVW